MITSNFMVKVIKCEAYREKILPKSRIPVLEVYALNVSKKAVYDQRKPYSKGQSRERFNLQENSVDKVIDFFI